MREHREGCRVVHDGYGTCRCKPMTTPLTRAEVELLVKQLREYRQGTIGFSAVVAQVEAHDAAQRQTLAQQAQEIDLVKNERDKFSDIASLMTAGEHKARVEVEQFKQQLAAMTRERDEQCKSNVSLQVQLATAQARCKEVERLRALITQVVNDLPTKRDWLDPDLEAALKGA